MPREPHRRIPPADSALTPQERESQRLRALRAYAILDTPPEAAFERVARLAARFLHVPIALVSFVDENRQWFKAACGLDTREGPREISFCTHAIQGNDVLVVPDAALDARFAGLPAVTEPPHTRFYAGAPLRTPEGENLGTLCVCDHQPRELSADDVQVLRELAATVVDELELRRCATNLRRQIAQRIRAERTLERTLRSVESKVQARTAELSSRNAQLRAEIASREEAETALRLAKEEADLANSAKSSFLSRMSHELRTPLNAILGFSQLLQMDAATERQRECVRHVLGAGQQLLSMIDDVLDISRLELGRGAPSLDAVLPREAIATAIDAARPLAESRQVAVSWEDGPAAGRPVLVNRQRLHQVLGHLLANAIKYNLAGGRVTVACREMPAARLRISVTDTGPGIAPEKLARLFKPFDRLDAERTDEPGSGLGLALCKNLVEAQGGRVGVESTSGEGSTFWIQLPLAAPAPRPPESRRALSAERDAAIPGPLRRVPRKRRRTILYIEDNDSNLRLIERLLHRYPNVRLLTATRGRDGLDLARRRRPDLVLLDSHLPDLSGREVLAALRGDPATLPIPVVVVSADALPANIEELRRAGAQHYLTKPLDVVYLMELLTKLT